MNTDFEGDILRPDQKDKIRRLQRQIEERDRAISACNLLIETQKKEIESLKEKLEIFGGKGVWKKDIVQAVKLRKKWEAASRKKLGYKVNPKKGSTPDESPVDLPHGNIGITALTGNDSGGI